MIGVDKAAIKTDEFKMNYQKLIKHFQIVFSSPVNSDYNCWRSWAVWQLIQHCSANKVKIYQIRIYQNFLNDKGAMTTKSFANFVCLTENFTFKNKLV